MDTVKGAQSVCYLLVQSGKKMCGQKRRTSIVGHPPRHDDDKVQLVPLVAKVTVAAKNPQGHHLDDHFHRKESKYTVIQNLKGKQTEQKTIFERPKRNLFDFQTTLIKDMVKNL